MYGKVHCDVVWFCEPLNVRAPAFLHKQQNSTKINPTTITIVHSINEFIDGSALQTITTQERICQADTESLVALVDAIPFLLSLRSVW